MKTIQKSAVSTQPEKPLRLFVNPLAIWTGLAFRTGEAMLASVNAASAPAKQVRQASKVRGKRKTGGKAKRRAKR